MLSTTWQSDQSKWENQGRMTYSYNAVSFIQSKLADNQLIVFPNPFNDNLTIVGEITLDYHIQLFNANGQLIRTFQKDEFLSNINLATLKNGCYYIQAISPKSQQVIKILKAK